MPLVRDRNQRSTPDIPALTGVRLFAALGVLLFHFSGINADANNFFSWGILEPLVSRGALGVDVFFVLSGFILAYVYGQRFQSGVTGRTWLTFLQNRLARLYPLHIITMIAMFAIYLLGRNMGVTPHQAEAFSWYSIIANLLLVHAWFPGLVGALNGPAWSISAEWFAYLLFPLLCVWLSRRSLFWSVAVVATTLSIVSVMPHMVPLVEIVLQFSFGVAVYELTSRNVLSIGRWGAWAAIIVVIVSMYGFSSVDPGQLRITIETPRRVAIMLASALAFASLSQSQGAVSRFLSRKTIVYGGEISYAMYMCHWAIWAIVHRGLERLPAFRAISHFWFIALALLLTVAVSIACYHLIELPGRTTLRRLSFNKVRFERKDLITDLAA